MYAIWEPILVEISFDLNDQEPNSSTRAQLENQTLYVSYEDTFENAMVNSSGGRVSGLVDPTREGYRFLGWFNESGTQITNATQATIENGVISQATGNYKIKLTAKWEARQYTVTYYTNSSI